MSIFETVELSADVRRICATFQTPEEAVAVIYGVRGKHDYIFPDGRGFENSMPSVPSVSFTDLACYYPSRNDFVCPTLRGGDIGFVEVVDSHPPRSPPQIFKL